MKFVHVYQTVKEFIVKTDNDNALDYALEMVKADRIEGIDPQCEFVAIEHDDQKEDQTYFLDQDNDCHWYLVKDNFRKEWIEWLELPEHDQRSWHAPEFAEPIGSHPNNIIFNQYKKAY